jgi:hypothetical protein
MTNVIGILPHLIIIPIIFGVLLFLGLITFLIHKKRDREWHDDGWMITTFCLWAVALIFGIIAAVNLIPYDSKYHVIYKLEGTVESVTNVLEGDGDGERTLSPIVKLSGYSEPIEFDNSRITTLKGREVVLTCTYAWQMHGLDITQCELKAIK